ncbi:hypothetical protein M413DRAFT_28230 [Hebeloma cylindrosporum]|uniref:Uncharacterized protein n=1 Tax=Hebeloma cylindrosporum TaxID=76867 RepID=A0A0C3BX79_HEBCY|nr:hypothetical protein M413DRAFT_28230 [Hebeloma cylindrosporum h7]
MALAGFCISRSGIDIALASTEDGALQGSASIPVQQIDPLAPNVDALIAPFTSLASQHPAEVTVLAISTQALYIDDYAVLLHKIGLIPDDDDDRFTIDYIGAYLAGLREDEVASTPCLLFIEITPTSFIAQLVKIFLRGNKRSRVPVYAEATTSSTTTLPTFVGQLFAWAKDHDHKLLRCVLLDPPSGYVDGTAMQTALASDCPIIIVDGAQLAKYAASYTFLNLEDLRLPGQHQMAQYVAPCPISFVANDSPPTLIIHRSEPLDADRDIIFTTSEKNQTSVAVEFAFGMHDTRPDDRLIFAKVTLEGLQPVGEGHITVSTSISPGYVSVEVFQGSERDITNVQAAVQISDLFKDSAYNMFWYDDSLRVVDNNISVL